jgi:hypothetical protein
LSRGSIHPGGPSSCYVLWFVVSAACCACACNASLIRLAQDGNGLATYAL